MAMIAGGVDVHMVVQESKLFVAIEIAVNPLQHTAIIIIFLPQKDLSCTLDSRQQADGYVSPSPTP